MTTDSLSWVESTEVAPGRETNGIRVLHVRADTIDYRRERIGRLIGIRSRPGERSCGASGRLGARSYRQVLGA
ncbi:hypothetical protein GCM10011588_33140 [Nocardia jinanensis]|uniref:Uncharacterized protein n=1 Tax=Nocardia jinanensis TaxID=382504 RepID=A0A917RNA7_9NOCA|nr:hypothetical protein GCM10011588_33140 [Nocardia jinanensis]